jgi:hypothetical protein
MDFFPISFCGADTKYDARTTKISEENKTSDPYT